MNMPRKNWFRNRNSIEFPGLWERLNNPGFKPVEFDGFGIQAGLNNFTLTPQAIVQQPVAPLQIAEDQAAAMMLQSVALSEPATMLPIRAAIRRPIGQQSADSLSRGSRSTGRVATRAAVDAQINAPDDKPISDLLLCNTRKRTVAECALSSMEKPIRVAEYQLVRALPTIDELDTELSCEPDPKAQP